MWNCHGQGEKAIGDHHSFEIVGGIELAEGLLDGGVRQSSEQKVGLSPVRLNSAARFLGVMQWSQLALCDGL
jgi:hypothetical protein